MPELTPFQFLEKLLQDGLDLPEALAWVVDDFALTDEQAASLKQEIEPFMP